MLRAKDSPNDVKISLAAVPPDAFLAKLVNESSGIPVSKSPTGSIITQSTESELNILACYLNQGHVSPDTVEILLELLDFYGVYTLRTCYPTEFAVIKIREDWFRRAFSSDPAARTSTFNLLQLSNERLLSYKLLHNLHFIYARKVYSRKTDVDLAHLIRKARLETTTWEEPRPSKQTLLHSYPRLYVGNMTVDQVVDKVIEVDAQFIQRDEMFDGHIIRESLRTNRGRMTTTYDTEDISRITISPNWSQTTGEVLSSLRSYEICQFFDRNPSLWANLLLAGGSVANAILSCSMNTDYDFFIYGLSETEATAKIREIIQLLSQAYRTIQVTRTSHAVTCRVGGYMSHRRGRRIAGDYTEVQFILRLYSSISEILHGFDVDSSCVGYDGVTVYLTERADHAFRDLVNMIDFDRMSPSYEVRLSKYMKRGFSVYVPGFEWSSVDQDKVTKHWLNRSDFWMKKRKLIKRLRRNAVPEDEIQVEVAKLRSERLPLKGLEILLMSYFSPSTQFYSRESDYGRVGYSCATDFENLSYGVNSDEAMISYSVSMEDESRRKSRPRRKTEKKKDRKLVPKPVDAIFDLAALPGPICQKVRISPVLEWKSLNPSEQVSSTFHQLVLDDVSVWYKSRFGRGPVEIVEPNSMSPTSMSSTTSFDE